MILTVSKARVGRTTSYLHCCLRLQQRLKIPVTRCNVIKVFAISPGQVAAISLDINNNHCYHTVPLSREWREDQDSLSEEQTIQDNTSIVAITVLSVLAVFAFMISVGLVIVRVRNSRPAGGEDYNDDMPELPYTVPVRALQTSTDNSSAASDQPSSDYEVVQINFGLERNSP